MKPKNVKVFLTAVLATAALLIAGEQQAYAQEQDSVAMSRTAIIAEDLSLSEDQSKNVLAVIDSDQTKAKALIRETYIQLSRQLEAFAEERNLALKEVLTDEQFQKLKKYMRNDDLWSSQGTPTLPNQR
ncbi:hypothetical protein [Parapedobacter sp. 10938]|uniref:hypothetical protein n=1 Tax=Parapedobacter flavus TaxID=3110225 RepID=UPI002DB715C1|nr:hypothetical protein [Parapedobacter sp. 10938]MEC3881843.1 hypothetical protein [Parapedobacter sp. 10938]